MQLSALLLVAVVSVGQTTAEKTTGVVVAKETVDVAAQNPGVVMTLAVKEGDEVSADTVLAKLDDEDARSAHLAALSELKVAEKEADNDINIRAYQKAADVAQAEWQESVEVNKRSPGSIPNLQVRREKMQYERALLQTDVAKLEQDVAKLTREVKQEQVNAAKRTLDRRVIKSPVAGYVEHHYLDKGEWAKDGAPIFRIVRSDKVNVEVFVKLKYYQPEDLAGKSADIFLGKVQTDDEGATVVVPDYEGTPDFQGKITFVSQVIDAGGEFRVWIEVGNKRVEDNPKFWVLKHGLNVFVKLPPQPDAK